MSYLPKLATYLYCPVNPKRLAIASQWTFKLVSLPLLAGVRQGHVRLRQDAVSTAAIDSEEVLDALNRDTDAENRTEHRQFPAAELAAKVRCFGDRAVIFDEFDRAIQGGSALGHKSFLTPDTDQCGHALGQWQVWTGHPCAIGDHLLVRPFVGDTFQAFFAENALNHLTHVNRELGVVIRESFMGHGYQLPNTCRSPQFALLVAELNQPLCVQDGKVLMHGHSRDGQLLY